VAELKKKMMPCFGFKNQGGKSMKKIMSLVIVLSMLLAPLAFAASPWTEEKTYGEKTVGKLGYGLTNTILGWTKLFSTPNEYSNEGKNVWSGVGQGVIDAGVTTVLGAVQLVTFAIPADIPIPSDVNLSGAKK
jgi:hypothetical protein